MYDMTLTTPAAIELRDLTYDAAGQRLIDIPNLTLGGSGP